MAHNQVEYSLLEPLMGSDAEMQQDALEFEFKPLNLNRRSSLDVEAITKDGGGRFEHTCGKTRLLVLGLLAFVLVYVSIASTRVDLPTIIVHVPPDDVEEVPFMLSSVPNDTTTITTTTTTTTTSKSIIPVSSSDYFSNISTSSSITDPPNSTTVLTNDSLTVPNGYLVWTPQCKIASLNPTARDVMAIYHREKPINCATKTSLTAIDWNPAKERFYLYVIPEAKKAYQRALSGDIQCSYQLASRASENKVKMGESITFTYRVELPVEAEFIYVECFMRGHKVPPYKDVHMVVQQKESIRKRLEALQKGQDKTAEGAATTTERPGKKFPSVLMIGIDSISRLNLLRAMPNTAQYLYDTGWFEMKGYNKMGDNTYPNLMAILTGYNISWAYDKCQPTTEHGLDNCPFIWKEFAAAGFVTGYSEDEPEIGTFNYRKKGFSANPTDFYGRPGVLVANRLPKVTRSSMDICLGNRPAADYIYNYGFDITERYREEGTFGLYWTNSFSHNDLNTPSMMDDRVKQYLIDLQRRDFLNDTIVIFFSDHGIRFGPVRKLVTGWQEERLPFLFFWLPPSFREQHPEIVQALKVNRNRLTNPYDLHLTLKHILRLSGRAAPLEEGASDVALGCENCLSMFREVPWNRSCEEIGIAAHWCTCAPYMPIRKDSAIVKKAAKFLLDYINKDIKRLLNGATNANGTGSLCAELHLNQITFAGETEYKAEYNDILLTFETRPGGGDFESTVRYLKAKDQFVVTGSISRLNTYSKHSSCVSDEHLKMYCECL